MRRKLEQLQIPEDPVCKLISEDATFSQGDLVVGREGVLNVPDRPPSSHESAGTREPSARSCASSRQIKGAAVDLASAPSPSSLDSLRANINLADLEDLGVIGRGSQGHVQKSLHKPSGTIMAVKRVHVDMSSEEFKKLMGTELSTMQRACHRNVVYWFQSFYVDGACTIVMEYMDRGTLAQILKHRRDLPIPEPQLAAIARQVLKGLQYIHTEEHLIHRDIKPSNILVNSLGELKISDFGVSGQLLQSVSKCMTWVGTVTYMSPERIKGSAYSYESDIWSFGLVMFECAYGRFPYATDGTAPGFWDLMDTVVEGAPPTPPPGSSQALKDFLMLCVQKDPSRRPRTETLLSHAFLKAHAEQNDSAVIADLVANMPMANPVKQGS